MTFERREITQEQRDQFWEDLEATTWGLAILLATLPRLLKLLGLI